MSPQRVYDMKAIVADCSPSQDDDDCTPEAIAAVLAHDPPVSSFLDENSGTVVSSGNASSSAAKTLYFAPGTDYVIDSPVAVNKDGIVFRGDGGSYHDPGTGELRGTTLSCAVVTSGASCIGVTGDGFTFEGITMAWEAGASRSSSRIGLLVTESEHLTIRDAYWADFPGTSLKLRESCEPVLVESVRFRSDESDSTYALHSSGVYDYTADGDRPHNVTVRDVVVEGYDYGLRFYGGVAVTVENSVFREQDWDGVRATSVLQLRIRDCRFFSHTSTGMRAGVYVLRDAGLTVHEPDVVISDSVFDMGCATGRKALDFYGLTGVTARVGVDRLHLPQHPQLGIHGFLPESLPSL